MLGKIIGQNKNKNGGLHLFAKMNKQKVIKIAQIDEKLGQQLFLVISFIRFFHFYILIFGFILNTINYTYFLSFFNELHIQIDYQSK